MDGEVKGWKKMLQRTGPPVQAVQVPDVRIRLSGENLPVVEVQVQNLGELVPVIDLSGEGRQDRERAKV